MRGVARFYRGEHRQYNNRLPGYRLQLGEISDGAGCFEFFS